MLEFVVFFQHDVKVEGVLGKLVILSRNPAGWNQKIDVLLRKYSPCNARASSAFTGFGTLVKCFHSVSVLWVFDIEHHIQVFFQMHHILSVWKEKKKLSKLNLGSGADFNWDHVSWKNRNVDGE